MTKVELVRPLLIAMHIFTKYDGETTQLCSFVALNHWCMSKLFNTISTPSKKLARWGHKPALQHLLCFIVASKTCRRSRRLSFTDVHPGTETRVTQHHFRDFIPSEINVEEVPQSQGHVPFPVESIECKALVYHRGSFKSCSE